MKRNFHLLLIGLLAGCSSGELQFGQSGETGEPHAQPTAVDEYWKVHHQDSVPGTSIGTVHNGRLENGTVVPFSGDNFFYFDSTSYLNGRAFTHQSVCRTIVQTYAALAKVTEHRFGLMELSNEHGGEIYPHRTHQNGMSVDFMSPLVKHGRPYTAQDFVGGPHYLMDFDNTGHWTEDSEVLIDFDLIARHILALDSTAGTNGLQIEKVIWKMELRDELFATPAGKKLQASGIYITRQLTPLINSLHDDHYHVDFKQIR